jgi:hypothetical protein
MPKPEESGEQPMPDDKKPKTIVAESGPELVVSTKAGAVLPKLGRAAESGDAGVQNLLAERHIHASNGDDDNVADVDRRLAELGYAV